MKPKMETCGWILAMGLACGLDCVSWAESKVSQASGDWMNSDTWVIPGDDVYIANAGIVRFTSSVPVANATVRDLRIGTTGEAGGKSPFPAIDSSSGTLIISGGTLEVLGTLNVGDSADALGRLFITGGGLRAHTLTVGARIDGARTEGGFEQTGGAVTLTGSLLLGSASAAANAENVNGEAYIAGGTFEAAGLYIGGIGGNPARGEGHLRVGPNAGITTTAGGSAGALSLRSTGTLRFDLGAARKFNPIDARSGFVQFIAGSRIVVDGSLLGAAPGPVPIPLMAYDSVKSTASIVEFTGFHSSLRPELRWSPTLLMLFPNGAPPHPTDTPIELMIGARRVRTDKSTQELIPVVPMWDAPVPRQNVSRAGFPAATGAEHSYIWQPANNGVDWAFNHFPSLVCFQNRFFVMWGNHPIGESGPGQRVLYAWSDDEGKTWTKPNELFPIPGEVGAPGTKPDIHLGPDRWIMIDGRLFAVAYVVANGIYPVAREVAWSGQPGEPFLLRVRPAGSALPLFMRELPTPDVVPSIAADLRAWYSRNTVVSWWMTVAEGGPRYAIDGASMIEPVAYVAADGGKVMLLRSMPSTVAHPPANSRMYVSFDDGHGGWAIPWPTDIPDAPSRTDILVLADGTTLLTGNQIAPEFDAILPRYRTRDPLTLAVSPDGLRFDHVFSLRAGAPTGYRIPGISQRTLGFGYPSSWARNGWLYTVYSIGKEDIALTRVPLDCLGIDAPSAGFSAWAAEAGLAGRTAMMEADPDQDGRSNLLEYAFGGTPTKADHGGGDPSASVVQDEMGNDCQLLTFTWHPDRLDAIYQVEVSSDGVTWQAGHAYGVGISNTLDLPTHEIEQENLPQEGIRVAVRAPSGVAGRFMRMSVRLR